jgi:S-methylmethionine-dependent homocysteine/selenocysteine methylase
MHNIFQKQLIIGEGSINERIRRSSIKLHPNLENAPLIYGDKKQAMAEIYRSYINIAAKASLPIIINTPTWRANIERVEASEFSSEINIDACSFMHEIRNEYPELSDKIIIGGLVGCKNDCYLPSEALSEQEAEEFHSWQINELEKGGVDFISPETLPALSEAIGMAKAASKTEVPYIISFVISREGKILDGTTLADAISTIDKSVSVPPLGYAVNCAHPSFLKPETQDKNIFKRLIAFNANASSLDHCDLDNSDCLLLDDIQEWGEQMLELNKKWGIKIIGGCCGAGPEHIQYLVDNY